MNKNLLMFFALCLALVLTTSVSALTVPSGRDVPIACEGGNLISDVPQGNSCRVVTCSDRTVQVCDNGAKTQFSISHQSGDKQGSKVCLADTEQCLNDWGYKSFNLPFEFGEPTHITPETVPPVNDIPGHVADNVYCDAYGDPVVIENCAYASDGDFSTYAVFPHDVLRRMDNVIHMKYNVPVGATDVTYTFSYFAPEDNPPVLTIYAYNYTLGDYYPLNWTFPPSDADDVSGTVEVHKDFLQNGVLKVRADIYHNAAYISGGDAYVAFRDGVVNYEEPVGDDGSRALLYQIYLLLKAYFNE